MSPGSRNMILVVLNALVWTLNILTINGTLTFSAKKGIPIKIETAPSRTRLSVNGSIWQAPGLINGWFQSPLTIYLPAGQHKLSLERHGYASHSFKVLLGEKDQDMTLSTELEPLPDAVNEVEVAAADDEDLEVTAILDQGLESGALPLIANDLVPGLHSLEIRSTESGDSKVKPFVCTFSIQSTGNPPIKITVSKKGSRFQVNGCQRLRRLQ